MVLVVLAVLCPALQHLGSIPSAAVFNLIRVVFDWIVDWTDCFWEMSFYEFLRFLSVDGD